MQKVVMYTSSSPQFLFEPEYYRLSASTNDPNATTAPQNRDPAAYPLTADALADFDAEGEAAEPVDAVVVAPVNAAALDNTGSVVKAAVRPVALVHALGTEGSTPLTKLTAAHCNLLTLG